MTLPKHFGIDFGKNSVKVAYLERSQNKYKVKCIGSRDTLKEAIGSSSHEHKKVVIESIKSLWAESRIPVKEVAFSIPEQHVFSKVIRIPKVSEKEVEETVFWRLKQLLPYDIDEVQKDYSVVAEIKSTGERDVLTVAAPKQIIQLYIEILETAGFVPIAVESEMISLIRTVRHINNQITDGLVLDLGSDSVALGIFSEGELYFSQDLENGSDILTKVLMNELSLNYEQAERYKRTYGLDKTNAKAYTAMKSVLDGISSQILRNLEFYRNDYKKPNPRNIYLAGEGALLIGIKEFFTETVGLTTEVVNPWSNITLNSLDSYANLGPGYSICIGLCLKE